MRVIGNQRQPQVTALRRRLAGGTDSTRLYRQIGAVRQSVARAAILLALPLALAACTAPTHHAGIDLRAANEIAPDPVVRGMKAATVRTVSSNSGEILFYNSKKTSAVKSKQTMGDIQYVIDNSPYRICELTEIRYLYNDGLKILECQSYKYRITTMYGAIYVYDLVLTISLQQAIIHQYPSTLIDPVSPGLVAIQNTICRSYGVVSYDAFETIIGPINIENSSVLTRKCK